MHYTRACNKSVLTVVDKPKSPYGSAAARAEQKRRDKNKSRKSDKRERSKVAHRLGPNEGDSEPTCSTSPIIVGAETTSAHVETARIAAPRTSSAVNVSNSTNSASVPDTPTVAARPAPVEPKRSHRKVAGVDRRPALPYPEKYPDSANRDAHNYEVLNIIMLIT
jgi:hypothetical protein